VAGWGREILGTFLVTVFICAVTGGNQNEPYLLPLLFNLQQEFDAAEGLRWALEGGTLLGAIRDGGIIGHEFDLDFTIMQADLPKLSKLKPLFREKYGYTLLECGDRSMIKGVNKFLSTFTWDPYIGWNPNVDKKDDPCFPCARIYDAANYFSADVFCDYEVYPADLDAMLVKTRAKRPIDVADKYFCNGNSDGIACRAIQHVLPPKDLVVRGRTMKVPAEPEKILRQGYGDRWRKKIPNGIKKLTGHWMGRLSMPCWIYFFSLRSQRIGAALVFVIAALVADHVNMVGMAVMSFCGVWAGNRLQLESAKFQTFATSVSVLFNSVPAGWAVTLTVFQVLLALYAMVFWPAEACPIRYCILVLALWGSLVHGVVWQKSLPKLRVEIVYDDDSV